MLDLILNTRMSYGVPITMSIQKKIEYVQKNFYSFLFKKIIYYNVIKFAPYEFKCSMLNIKQLSDRRKNARILFVYDVLTGRIDSPKLLSLLDINVPVQRLRNHSFIRILICWTNASFVPVKYVIFVY